ncbi:MAG: hypothetical protein AAGF56_15660, partial [Pseudomonadota bacterium]
HRYNQVTIGEQLSTGALKQAHKQATWCMLVSVFEHVNEFAHGAGVVGNSASIVVLRWLRGSSSGNNGATTWVKRQWDAEAIADRWNTEVNVAPAFCTDSVVLGQRLPAAEAERGHKEIRELSQCELG